MMHDKFLELENHYKQEQSAELTFRLTGSSDALIESDRVGYNLSKNANIQDLREYSPYVDLFCLKYQGDLAAKQQITREEKFIRTVRKQLSKTEYEIK